AAGTTARASRAGTGPTPRGAGAGPKYFARAVPDSRSRRVRRLTDAVTGLGTETGEVVVVATEHAPHAVADRAIGDAARLRLHGYDVDGTGSVRRRRDLVARVVLARIEAAPRHLPVFASVSPRVAHARHRFHAPQFGPASFVTELNVGRSAL